MAGDDFDNEVVEARAAQAETAFWAVQLCLSGLPVRRSPRAPSQSQRQAKLAQKNGNRLWLQWLQAALRVLMTSPFLELPRDSRSGSRSCQSALSLGRLLQLRRRTSAALRPALRLRNPPPEGALVHDRPRDGPRPHRAPAAGAGRLLAPSLVGPRELGIQRPQELLVAALAARYELRQLRGGSLRACAFARPAAWSCGASQHHSWRRTSRHRLHITGTRE